MSDKLSIIVPVYNTARYLDQCIESILNQTYKDFECLLIDDGSTDGSDKICDSWKEKDQRIRVFHVPNGGPSRARNVGIKNMSGKYLGFVDSDDVIAPDMYEAMISKMEETGVVEVSCGFVVCDEKLNEIHDPTIVQLYRYGKMHFSDMVELFFLDGHSGEIGGGIQCNKVFDYENLKAKMGHDILYNEDVFAGEDSLWLHGIHSKLEGTAFVIETPFYYWRRHPFHHGEHDPIHSNINAIFGGEKRLLLAKESGKVTPKTIRIAERRLATECWQVLWDNRSRLKDEKLRDKFSYALRCYKKYGPRNIDDKKEVIKHPMKYLMLLKNFYLS